MCSVYFTYPPPVTRRGPGESSNRAQQRNESLPRVSPTILTVESAFAMSGMSLEEQTRLWRAEANQVRDLLRLPETWVSFERKLEGRSHQTQGWLFDGEAAHPSQS